MSKLITVAIPGPSGSRSKMQKKGWKCWAKWLSSVVTPASDGYAYEGEFTTAGSTVEASLGDVLLHVDQSSSAGVGVVMENKAGKTFVRWVETADSEGRKWCGPLAGPARRLLDMDTEDRIRYVATLIVADRPSDRPDEVHAYWESLANPTPSRPMSDTLVTGATMTLATLIEQLTALRKQATGQANIEALDDALQSAGQIVRCIGDVEPEPIAE